PHLQEIDLNRSEETTVRSWPSAVWPGKICSTNAEGNFCKAKAKESGAGERLSRYQSQQGDKYATTSSTRCGIDDGPLRADHRRHFMLYRAARASGVLIPLPLFNDRADLAPVNGDQCCLKSPACSFVDILTC